MAVRFTAVYLQPLAVTSADLSSTDCAAVYSAPEGTVSRVEATVPNPEPIIVSTSQIVTNAFSSIPLVTQAELAQEYQELGQALSEMAELEDGDDWKLESSVYASACYVANALLAGEYYPSPRLFSHGPKSVVFNWTHNQNNLYLTVSADRLSALMSTPQRIQRRIELRNPGLLDAGHLLSAISFGAQPTPPLLRANISEPKSELVG